MTDPLRPGAGGPTPATDGQRRSAMVPSGPTEEFIVPLLERHVAHAITLVADAQRQLGTAPRTALDAGCGRKPFAARLLDEGYRYRCLDVPDASRDDLDYAVPLDAPASRFDGLVTARFDLILCTEVLEHVLDWDLAFRNLSAVMADEGALIVSAPHVYPLHEEPHDFWRPTLHAIEGHAQRHGLVACRSWKVGTAVDVLATLGAALYFEPRRAPGARPIVRARVAAALLNRFRDLARALGRMNLAPLVHIDAPWYLSNVALLTRPGSALHRRCAEASPVTPAAGDRS